MVCGPKQFSAGVEAHEAHGLRVASTVGEHGARSLARHHKIAGA